MRAQTQPALCGGGQVIEGWVVTDRTLCPDCLRPAGGGDHPHCSWGEMGWKPEETAAEALSALPAQAGDRQALAAQEGE